MNTASLARQYRALTPWERVPLILAAAARGDELEETRLINSAPMQLYRSADHNGFFDALTALADDYMMRQLALAGRYWQGRVFVNRDDFLLADSPQAEENRKCLELLAYRFQVLAAAWKEFCAELQVDPEPLLQDMPGYDLVCSLEQLAKFTTWTAEEAATCARELFEADRANAGKGWTVKHPYRSDSIAEEVRAMGKFLEARVGSSPRSPL